MRNAEHLKKNNEKLLFPSIVSQTHIYWQSNFPKLWTEYSSMVTVTSSISRRNVNSNQKNVALKLGHIDVPDFQIRIFSGKQLCKDNLMKRNKKQNKKTPQTVKKENKSQRFLDTSKFNLYTQNCAAEVHYLRLAWLCHVPVPLEHSNEKRKALRGR